MARRTDPLSVYLREKYPGGLPKSGRDHAEITEAFKLWFKHEYQMTAPSQAWRLIPNNSGMAHHRDGTVIPYGLPPGGGGPDLFAFGPLARTVFYEVKTYSSSTLRANQIRWADTMIGLGFDYWVVMEDQEDSRGFELVRYARD